MRQQMRAVKQFQAYKVKVERKAKPLAKTAFTKLKPDKGSEEELAAREARRKSKTNLSVQNFYGPNGEWNPPVLIVDGYNVCGFWPKLSKHFHRGDLEEARTRLLNELANYSQYRGIKTICVFDAKGGPNEGTTVEIMCECLSVVFYADCTADTWIETQSNELLAADDAPPYLLVASNDLECIRVSNAFGAKILTCKLLIQEINRARKEISARAVSRGARALA
ncbi:hypothetical protein CYMTET_41638 [Cymbomonas tetramitiformis]|uniref:Uncharacterized protein n=1 Tax=Cymbomonas tetramitiformis TaxID=36881 RepID=A0AAE0F2F8_9CHLO|nr:hypothetical protein CYMTET_41638 [Cymbomonas tetramitiformis]